MHAGVDTLFQLFDVRLRCETSRRTDETYRKHQLDGTKPTKLAKKLISFTSSYVKHFRLHVLSLVSVLVLGSVKISIFAGHLLPASLPLSTKCQKRGAAKWPV